MIVPFLALACPLDGAPLHRKDSSWCCASGHGFDIASQGYTHLLPVQKKRSRDPGDSKEMVAARRRFLNAGCYQPIAWAASQAVLADLPPNVVASCLDAGCGDGYYLRQLAEAATSADARTNTDAGTATLSNADVNASIGSGIGTGTAIDSTETNKNPLALLGLDISKWAVLAAAKQDKRSNWVVGSNANLPILPGTLDRVLCMFGFPVYAEFARVLKADGQLLQVDTGPDHLRELREIIYPSLKAERAADSQVPQGFSQLSTEIVSYCLELDGAQQIADLLSMTPHLYRASAEGRAKAATLTELTVTVDVRLTRFRRDAAS